MTLLQAVVLGAIQGLTEFIPVSSSGHLILIPWLLGWHQPDISFYAALHLGTLIALVAYFWRDWRAALNPRSREDGEGPSAIPHSARVRTLALACVPTVVAGMALEYVAEHGIHNPVWISVMMIALGVALAVADRIGAKNRSIHATRSRDWFVIGLAQALAVIPGVSRSGSTISAALFCGFEREAAARLSFLIGVPIIFGAAALELAELILSGFRWSGAGPFLLGIATAAIVGYLSIGLLLGYVRRRGMGVFVIYRLVFGGAVIVACLLRA